MLASSETYEDLVQVVENLIVCVVYLVIVRRAFQPRYCCRVLYRMGEAPIHGLAALSVLPAVATALPFGEGNSRIRMFASPMLLSFPAMRLS